MCLIKFTMMFSRIWWTCQVIIWVILLLGVRRNRVKNKLGLVYLVQILLLILNFFSLFMLIDFQTFICVWKIKSIMEMTEVIKNEIKHSTKLLELLKNWIAEMLWLRNYKCVTRNVIKCDIFRCEESFQGLHKCQK